ncbi:MAG: glycosyltransferase [Thermosynechococcaceae cyanobacterium MS004]|nr:glycosyltransferase [Thermosynechococcaceae cyanobacterium MS004]
MAKHQVLDPAESVQTLLSGDQLLENQASLAGARIAIYSHDTMGLGHKRRNLLIAQTLADAIPNCSVLLISGMVEGSTLDLPDGIDYLALPAWQKNMDGQYEARRLDLPVQELTLLRAKIIRSAVKAFKPDVFLVDNVPRGALRELDLALEFLRRQRKTRCVLGLRDVLDEPETIRRQWNAAENEAAIRRYYNSIWIYGDPAVYDLAASYHFPPEIAAKIRYVGYLDARERLRKPRAQAQAHTQAHTQAHAGPHEPIHALSSRASATQGAVTAPEKMALCLVGGGQDGAKVAIAFAQADLPMGWKGVIVAGPFMPKAARQTLHQQAERHPNLTVLDHCAEPTQLLQNAQAVVAMGGYNTTCEVLSFEVQALIVPRVKPRKEQWIRAQRLQELGLVDVLLPDQLCPQAIAHWLRDIAAQPVPPRDGDRVPGKVRDRVDLKGLTRLPTLMAEVLTRKPSAQPATMTLCRNLASVKVS